MTVKDAIKEVGAKEGLLIMYRRVMPIVCERKVRESDILVGYCCSRNARRMRRS